MTRISVDAFQPQATHLLREDAARHSANLFVFCAGVVILIAYLSPFEYVWSQSITFDDQDDDRPNITARDGSLQKQVALGTLGLIGIATLAFSRERQLQLNTPIAWVFIAYLAWCAASCLWTDDFSITSRRVIGFGCEVLAGVAISQRASPRQFVWLVFGCALAWLGIGILSELAHNTFRPWQPWYRFMGVFYPNIMAGNCVLLALSSLYLSYAVPTKKRVLQVVGGVAIVFLVLTGSRTAIGTLVMLLALFLWFKASPAKKLFSGAMLAIAAACLMTLATVGDLENPTEWTAMGRVDHELSSLTGRVPLWDELLHRYASQKPFVGHGYGAFWTPNHIDDVAESQSWNPAYAHSTYIDLLLSVGLIGVALFVATIVPALLRAVRLETRYPAAGYGFVALLLACIVVDGVLETNFGATSFMSFFGSCAICYVLCSARQSRQMQPRYVTI
jgi:O-antigen ligase